MIEGCLERGMDKQATCQHLEALHVDPRVTEIVWSRLEAENPEFFGLYKAYVTESVQLERQNNCLSRCSSSCSLNTTQDANNVLSTGYGLCL
jgi:uncharacterized protein (TIGR01589 family)